MSDETGLLHAIGEAMDDSPHLVYADWLDEQGNGARAEFIRLQCRLQNTLPDDERQQLRVRERALLVKNRASWVTELGVSAEDVEFHRGMPHRVRIGEWSDDQVTNAVQQGRLASVAELDASGLKINDKQLDLLIGSGPLAGLNKLMLNDNELTNDGVNKIAQTTYPT